MSEPKAYRIIQGDTGGCGAPSYKCDTNANRIEEWSDACEVYDKFEADKVMADLEESHKMEVEQLLIETKRLENLCASYRHDCDYLAIREANALKEIGRDNRVIRHQKYKRCLAMAKWCEERYNYLTCLENWQMSDKEYQQVIGDYWDRWHKRWLKIAEKFKEKAK